jgi:hypothetical protein
MLTSSGREKLEGQKVDADIMDVSLMNKLFVRLGAKDKKFTKVDFRYSIFDTCYLRDALSILAISLVAAF